VSRACSTIVEPTLFEWDVFAMAAPIQSPAKCHVRSVIRTKRMCSALKFLSSTHRKEMSLCTTLWLEIKHGVFHHTSEGSRTMMRCKRSWRGSKDCRQTSMTRGCRSWFQDLINVWTMPATMLKNKVIYRQFIHSVVFVN